MVTFGEGGAYIEDVDDIPVVVGAMNKLFKDFMAGEERFMDFIGVAYQYVPLGDNDKGYELDLWKAGRTVTEIAKGAPYPRKTYLDTKWHFVRPTKKGARHDIYIEDLLGVSAQMQQMKMGDALADLQTDFTLAQNEYGAMVMYQAIDNAATPTDFIVDCVQATNETGDFTLEKLQDMIQKRRHNRAIQNMSDLVLILPTPAERTLRADGEFDDIPELKGKMIVNGQLLEKIEGISTIIINDSLPVKYDSAGNMNDPTAVPTGVMKLPVQFTDNAKELPRHLRGGAVPAAHWDIDHVALNAWLIEKNKCGVWVERKPSKKIWQPIVTNIKDEDYDSIGLKLRGFYNFSVPEDGRLGLPYMMRADNIANNIPT